MATKKTAAVSAPASTAVALAVNPTGVATPTPPSTGAGGAVPGAIPVAAFKGLRATLSALAQGWSTALPTGFVLPSSTGGYNQATILSQLEGWLAQYAAVDAVRKSEASTFAGLEAQLPAIRAQVAALRAALKGYFKADNAELAQFGIKPSKPKAKLSGQQLAIKAVRSQQTRDIRGTLGKVQKADKKSMGPLEVTVAAPASAGAAPAAGPAAAPVVAPANATPTTGA